MLLKSPIGLLNPLRYAGIPFKMPITRLSSKAPVLSCKQEPQILEAVPHQGMSFFEFMINKETKNTRKMNENLYTLLDFLFDVLNFDG